MIVLEKAALLAEARKIADKDKALNELIASVEKTPKSPRSGGRCQSSL
ncbi:hypothetical protein [Rhodoflexus caldus]|nr:hypothetical protein [Rhodoflexus caldus]